MKRSIALVVISVAAGMAQQAHAVLNEFSVADGYTGAFSTRVWTYNALWSFDGGNVGSNYVAQHGYGAGFPFAEPFGLVIRNDVNADNYRFSYNFVAADLGGTAPNAVAGGTITIGFDVMGVFSQGSTIANSASKLNMVFGGTRTSPGLTLGFSDSNKLMYSDAAGNLLEYSGYTLPGSWSRVTLAMNFATSTYDLKLSSLTGNYLNASNTYSVVNTYNVATGMPFTNAMSSLNTLWFETFTDPENGSGYGKVFLDHFTGASTVPAPGCAALLGCAGLVSTRRRRRA